MVAKFDQRKKLRQTLQRLKPAGAHDYGQDSEIEPEQIQSKRSSKVELANDEYTGERLVINLRDLPREITRNLTPIKT